MEINKIYNEDCLITMQKIENIDAIITSPPYNTSRKGSSLDNARANIRYDEFDDSKQMKNILLGLLIYLKATIKY